MQNCLVEYKRSRFTYIVVLLLLLFLKSMINSIQESGASYLLTLRSERPVEGCELTPNAFIQLKGGYLLDNSARAKLLDSNPYFFSYQWSRGPRKQICSNAECPRGNTYDPINWSKAALGGPELICNVCERAGISLYESSFCSVSCFKTAWNSHSLKHTCTTRTAAVSIGSLNENSDNLTEETKDVVGRIPLNTSEDEWIPICKDKEYVPTGDEVGCRLKIEVTALAVSDDSVLAGPIVVYTDPVLSAPAPPPKRRLLAIPGAVAGIAAAVRFRIISYNILAELYATKQAYPYCDAWSLAWSYRRKIILAELEEMQGDVVCLQEVQADHYEKHLNPFMNELGYDGMYKQKSREFMGQYGKVDGCATFWKRNKFIMTENYSIEFNEIARQEAAKRGLDEGEARKFMNRLSRDNIAQIIVLESLARPSGTTGRVNARTSLCVVNTHLYSNHQRSDVKLWQTMNLMRDAALILCGDFNSEPQSAVYEYLVSGCIEGDHYPELDILDNSNNHSHSHSHNNHSGSYNGGNGPNGSNGVRVLPSNLRSIVHDVDLASVMNTVIGSEPNFTNFTAKFKGTLDYIFYTPARLRVMAASSMPEEHEIRALSGEGLPSTCYPSDHMMLCCDVALIQSGSGSILSMSRGAGPVPSSVRSSNMMMQPPQPPQPPPPQQVSLGSLSSKAKTASTTLSPRMN